MDEIDDNRLMIDSHHQHTINIGGKCNGSHQNDRLIKGVRNGIDTQRRKEGRKKGRKLESIEKQNETNCI